MHVPFIGLLELYFFLFTTIALAAIFIVLWRLRRYFILVLAVLGGGVGVIWKRALGRSDTEGGVKGWLQALDMARVDAESDAFGQFVQDQQNQIRFAHYQKENFIAHSGLPPLFDLSKFEKPMRVQVLSASEAAEASALLLADKDNWIHMDRRTGPLPSFIYGTYYQYNSHGMDFPTPKAVSAARKAWLEMGAVEPPMSAIRATSTVAYADPSHGVQAYKNRLRQLFGRNSATGHGLDLHERLRAALANVTGMEVVYDDEWGLPGAQITFSHRVMEYEVFQAHIDGSWSPVVDGLDKCVPEHRLSVTLTLQKPSSGAGLDTWLFDRNRPGCDARAIEKASAAVEKWRSHQENGDVVAGNDARRSTASHSRDQFDIAAARRALNDDVAQALSCINRCMEAYTVGEAVVHSGSVIHALAPWEYRGGSYDEARVTIQGFAFLCGGKWHLHW